MATTKTIKLERGNQTLMSNKTSKKFLFFWGVSVFILVFIGYQQNIWKNKESTNISSSTLTVDSSKSGSTTTGSLKKPVFKTSMSKNPVKKAIKKDKNVDLSPQAEKFPQVVFADELITQLFDLKQRDDLYPQEIERRINGILQRLIYQGDEAIPAIQDYLKTLEDITYAERRVGDRVIDSKSLRISLYGVLDQIGGIEAINVLAGELENVQTPMEISALSDILDRQAPEEFREASLKAATSTYLKMTKGDLNQNDAAPLFDVLGKFGNADIASQLTDVSSDESSNWQLYAAAALSEIPNGEGIDALINSPLLKDPRSYQYEVPVRMLAQLAAENQYAREALIKQVRNGKIPDQLWTYLSGEITGTKQFQLKKPEVEIYSSELNSNPFPHQIYGTNPSQTFYIVDKSGELSSEQIEARIEVIDFLLEETDNSVAISSLQTAKESLSSKLPYPN